MGVSLKGKNELMSQLKQIFSSEKNVKLRVGFFSDANYPSIRTGRTGLRDPGKNEEDLQKEQTSRSVAHVAAIHEFGAPGSNIPARPFMRPTIEQLKNPSPELQNKIAAAFGIESSDAGIFDEAAAARLGEIIRGLIQDNILQDPVPEGAEKHESLSDATLAKRRYRRETDEWRENKERVARMKVIDPETGELELAAKDAVDVAKPLVDTGFLLNSVTWEIEGPEGTERRKSDDEIKSDG